MRPITNEKGIFLKWLKWRKNKMNSFPINLRIAVVDAEGSALSFAHFRSVKHQTAHIGVRADVVFVEDGRRLVDVRGRLGDFDLKVFTFEKFRHLKMV